uniref:Uncharacterized protein n=1 Tax=Anguilla anguilla TaxID=7936 RepID=A0A0E9RAI5_ANGAN
MSEMSMHAIKHLTDLISILGGEVNKQILFRVFMFYNAKPGGTIRLVQVCK